MRNLFNVIRLFLFFWMLNFSGNSWGAELDSIEVKLSSAIHNARLSIPGKYKEAIVVNDSSFWIYFSYPDMLPIPVSQSDRDDVVALLVKIVRGTGRPSISEIKYSSILRSIDNINGPARYKKIDLIDGFEKFSKLDSLLDETKYIYFHRSAEGDLICFDEVFDKITVDRKYKEKLSLTFIFSNKLREKRMEVNNVIVSFVNDLLKE